MMIARFVCSNRATRDAASLVGLLIWICFSATSVAAQPIEPSARVGGHVIELARFLESAEIYAGIEYPPLSVFPLRLRDGDPLARQAVKETGQAPIEPSESERFVQGSSEPVPFFHRPGVWLTMDDALASGRLVIFEKGGGGQVPLVQVENRSSMDHVLIMAGELLSGGKQARTVRQDVIVSPGQRVDVPVLCVEKRRWAGDPKFEAGQTLLPQAIYRELRQGADQDQIWAEVARNNAAILGWKNMGLAPSRHDENPTDSLQAALGDQQIRDRVRVARQRILPEVPRDAVGFVFVMGGRAAGAEFFGHRSLAVGLLPKLIDSYMVDVIIQGAKRPGIESDRRQQAAIEFFEQIRRGASAYANTPGAGVGIRSRTPGLLGEGVGLNRRLVHFGIQPGAMVIPHPRPDSR